MRPHPKAKGNPYQRRLFCRRVLESGGLVELSGSASRHRSKPIVGKAHFSRPISRQLHEVREARVDSVIGRRQNAACLSYFTSDSIVDLHSFLSHAIPRRQNQYLHSKMLQEPVEENVRIEEAALQSRWRVLHDDGRSRSYRSPLEKKCVLKLHRQGISPAGLTNCQRWSVSSYIGTQGAPVGSDFIVDSPVQASRPRISRSPLSQR